MNICVLCLKKYIFWKLTDTGLDKCLIVYFGDTNVYVIVKRIMSAMSNGTQQSAFTEPIFNAVLLGNDIEDPKNPCEY